MSNEMIPFSPGDYVVDLKNPGRPAQYTGKFYRAGPRVMVKLRYPDGTLRSRPLNVLEKQAEGAWETIEKRLEDGRYGKAHDLRRLITFEKLRGSLHEVIYSMEAAQIDFYPYQFKPVMKFIASPTSRLLLADEVGLGKTIESALIWLELQARRQARRLLVICPNILAKKWRDELRTKFQLDARIVDFNALHTEVDDLQAEGPTHPFVLIGTYTGLRPPKAELSLLYQAPGEGDSVGTPKTEFLRKLRYWSPSFAPFDLVVFDEAHYMRNTATTTFRLGESLAACADAVLCVSATPVNNKNRDLLSLLRLVDESVFENQALFDDLMVGNLPAVQAMNALARTPLDIGLLNRSMAALRRSRFVADLPLFKKLEAELGDLDEGDHEQIARCQDLAEKVNLIGSYVNRTRRVQVAESRPVRTPVVLTVEYSESERKLYDAILAMVRRKCALEEKAFHIFSLMGLQLRAASCLPAFAEEVRSGKLGDPEELFGEAFGLEATLDFGEEDEAREPDAQEFKDLLDEDFEGLDSKYAELRKLISGDMVDEKFIVFAFYRKTLAYLHRRLVEDGISVTQIHGGIDLDDRWVELEKFRDPQGPRVLLSSEVGSEGIDLQFCRVVVNYDLPWNPMRVEQRIGRVDRVNQMADRISIVNFKVRNTIEERLYERLHEKLMIFANSLGDLEALIGREVQSLTVDLLSRELSEEEECLRIERTERVIAERALQVQNLEDSGETLVALSDYVQRKIEEDKGRGRFIQPRELTDYVVEFFEQSFQGTQIDHNTPAPDCMRIRLSAEAQRSLEDYLADDRSLSARVLRQRELNITFFSEAMKSLPEKTRRKVTFVNHLSPLVRWMTASMQDDGGRFYDTSSISVELKRIPAGTYCYRIERWTLRGLVDREHLAYGIRNIETGEVLSAKEAEVVLNEVLRRGRDWDRGLTDGHVAVGSYRYLDDVLEDWFSSAVSDFHDENTTAIRMKKERVAAFFDRRIAQDRQRLDTLRLGGRTESLIRATEKRIENEMDAREQKLGELEVRSEVEPEREEIAGGVFRVV